MGYIRKDERREDYKLQTRKVKNLRLMLCYDRCVDIILSGAVHSTGSKDPMPEISLKAYFAKLNNLLSVSSADEVVQHARHILQTYPKNVTWVEGWC